MGPNEMNVWFYIKDRQQKGPAGFFELTKLFDQGVLNAETFLWTEGADCWHMAKNIDEFKPCVTANSPPDFSVLENEKPPESKPFVRFMAKLFDLSLFTFIFSTFISVFSLDLIQKTPKLTLFVVYLLIWIWLEPIMLVIFGTTVGYSLLNIKIKCVNGEFLDFITAFKRNLFAIPLGKCFRNPLSRKNVRTIRDELAGTIALYGTVSIPRKLVGSCLPLVVFIIGIIINKIPV